MDKKLTETPQTFYIKDSLTGEFKEIETTKEVFHYLEWLNNLKILNEG